MTPRDRRLLADEAHLAELARQDPRISFEAHGVPPERYDVALLVPGLARGAGGNPVVRTGHRATIELHRDYPRLPPVVRWGTPILHPNILPPRRHGGVCLGAWSAGEGLADVVARLVRLVTWQEFSVVDPLDADAAAWAAAVGATPGVDLDELAARSGPVPSSPAA